MELHQLEYVLAVEKHLHFSAAAEEINVTQPTLSHQIKRLEEEMGVQLFIRTTRSIQLTPAGREFVAYAKKILQEVENAKNAMIEYSQLKRGYLKVGAIPNLIYMGVIKLIADFQKKYPGIQIKLYEDNSDDLLKMMQANELDVAFITYPYISKTELDFYPLIYDDLVLVVSRNHPLANRDIVKVSELAEEKFLMVASTTGLRQSLIQLCREAGFEPNIIFETAHVETITGLVNEGIGITLFARRIAEGLASKHNRIIKLDTSLKRVTGLAVSRSSNLLATRTFKEFVLNHDNI